MKRSIRTFFKDNLAVQIGCLAIVLILICLGYRFSMHNRFTSYLPTHRKAEDVRDAEIVPVGDKLFEIESREDHDNYIRLDLKPVAPGDGYLNIVGEKDDYAGGDAYRIDRFMTIYDRGTGDFTGDEIVLTAITIFCFGVGFLMLRKFVTLRGPEFYSYTSVYTSGFSIFAISGGLQMLWVTIWHLMDPVRYNMFSAYRTIQSMSYRFLMLTMPLVAAFSAALIVSNAELLRHERRRFQNVLGILTGFILIGGEVIAHLLYSRDFSGSETQMRIHDTLQGVYATLLAYFICILAGAVICGLRAARHRPAQDRDFAVILGCLFRKDGTLTPLLRGRVDAAIRFAAEQAEKTGKLLTFVPSGGQGADESMAESEAMSRYLLSQGIPAERIMQENQSRNTYENMAFSKKLIEEKDPDAKVLYATTNYHVFRSGVWAGLAGLKAEGVGSRTKWWFWPNAFVRECAGLLLNRWKQELVGVVLMTAFFAVLTMLLG